MIILHFQVEECCKACSYNEEERIQSEEKRHIDQVLGEEQPHSDAENNDGQFPGVAGQESAQKQQQQQQQERFVEHVHEHRPGFSTRKVAPRKERTLLWNGCVQRLSKYF